MPDKTFLIHAPFGSWTDHWIPIPFLEAMNLDGDLSPWCWMCFTGELLHAKTGLFIIVLWVVCLEHYTKTIDMKHDEKSFFAWKCAMKQNPRHTILVPFFAECWFSITGMRPSHWAEFVLEMYDPSKCKTWISGGKYKKLALQFSLIIALYFLWFPTGQNRHKFNCFAPTF